MRIALLATIALFTLSTEAADAFRIEKDIAYLAPDRKEKADLYLPTATPAGARRPAVVIIHGGGWTGGDKGAAREINIGTNLALNGYVGLSINYVLASTNFNAGKPTWPQNLHDCMTAVRWLRKNAERLQVDPERIGVIGGSAGGHLAAMLAVLGDKDGLDPKGPYGEFSCRVKCAVDLYGPADLAGHHDASPVTYVDKNDPPILILHGTADKTVDIAQSKLFAAKLKEASAPHELVIVEGAPHTFHLQPKQADLRPKVLGFFAQHLKAAR